MHCVQGQQLIDDVRANRERQTGGGRGMVTTRLKPPLPTNTQGACDSPLLPWPRCSPEGRKSVWASATEVRKLLSKSPNQQSCATN